MLIIANVNWTNWKSRNLTISFSNASGFTRYNAALANSRPLKRYERNPRPVNVCPQSSMPRTFSHFKGSHCHSRHSGGFYITCSQGGDGSAQSTSYSLFGICGKDEICFDARTRTAATAWCAPESTFETPISVAIKPLKFSPQIFVEGPNPLGGQYYSIVLTNRIRRHELFRAQLLSITPVNASGNDVGQPAACTRCSSLELKNTPVETTHLEISVKFPNDQATAYLYGYVWRYNP